MQELILLNPENITDEEAKEYPLREAARAVIFDTDDKVGLLYVSKHNYYKLPGGGLEGKEDATVALRRECLEEIGCDVDIIQELGSIKEYRKIFGLTQISYCYLAKIKGNKTTPQLTDFEIADGFRPVWLPYNDAKNVLAESKATSDEGSLYIVPRDTIFLKEAGKYLKT